MAREVTPFNFKHANPNAGASLFLAAGRSRERIGTYLQQALDSRSKMQRENADSQSKANTGKYLDEIRQGGNPELEGFYNSEALSEGRYGYMKDERANDMAEDRLGFEKERLNISKATARRQKELHDQTMLDRAAERAYIESLKTGQSPGEVASAVAPTSNYNPDSFIPEEVGTDLIAPYVQEAGIPQPEVPFYEVAAAQGAPGVGVVPNAPATMEPTAVDAVTPTVAAVEQPAVVGQQPAEAAATIAGSAPGAVDMSDPAIASAVSGGVAAYAPQQDIKDVVSQVVANETANETAVINKSLGAVDYSSVDSADQSIKAGRAQNKDAYNRTIHTPGITARQASSAKSLFNKNKVALDEQQRKNNISRKKVGKDRETAVKQQKISNQRAKDMATINETVIDPGTLKKLKVPDVNTGTKEEIATYLSVSKDQGTAVYNATVKNGNANFAKILSGMAPGSKEYKAVTDERKVWRDELKEQQDYKKELRTQLQTRLTALIGRETDSINAGRKVPKGVANAGQLLDYFKPEGGKKATAGDQARMQKIVNEILKVRPKTTNKELEGFIRIEAGKWFGAFDLEDSLPGETSRFGVETSNTDKIAKDALKYFETGDPEVGAEAVSAPRSRATSLPKSGSKDYLTGYGNK